MENLKRPTPPKGSGRISLSADEWLANLLKGSDDEEESAETPQERQKRLEANVRLRKEAMERSKEAKKKEVTKKMDWSTVPGFTFARRFGDGATELDEGLSDFDDNQLSPRLRQLLAPIVYTKEQEALIKAQKKAMAAELEARTAEERAYKATLRAQARPIPDVIASMMSLANGIVSSDSEDEPSMDEGISSRQSPPEDVAKHPTPAPVSKTKRDSTVPSSNGSSTSTPRRPDEIRRSTISVGRRSSLCPVGRVRRSEAWHSQIPSPAPEMESTAAHVLRRGTPVATRNILINAAPPKSGTSRKVPAPAPVPASRRSSMRPRQPIFNEHSDDEEDGSSNSQDSSIDAHEASAVPLNTSSKAQYNVVQPPVTEAVLPDKAMEVPDTGARRMDDEPQLLIGDAQTEDEEAEIKEEAESAEKAETELPAMETEETETSLQPSLPDESPREASANSSDFLAQAMAALVSPCPEPTERGRRATVVDLNKSDFGPIQRRKTILQRSLPQDEDEVEEEDEGMTEPLVEEPVTQPLEVSGPVQRRQSLSIFPRRRLSAPKPQQSAMSSGLFTNDSEDEDRPTTSRNSSRRSTKTDRSTTDRSKDRRATLKNELLARASLDSVSGLPCRKVAAPTVIRPSIETPPPEGLRRSKRRRMAPVAAFLNQVPQYEQSPGGSRRLIGASQPKIYDKDSIRMERADPIEATSVVMSTRAKAKARKAKK